MNSKNSDQTLTLPSSGDEPAAVNRHYLYPGTLFAHREPHLVTTVLGSCVSVCLWDQTARIGGINHYLLPLWNGEGLPTPKYGNIAIAKLVEKVQALGAGSKLIAKVFGGASMWEKTDGLLAVGQRNIELAVELLDQQRIPVISSDLGGPVGRKIIFHTGDGTVLLKRQRALRADAE
ncbi:MAG: chemotaxis protein CheD [Desulfuromonadales bacterium]